MLDNLSFTRFTARYRILEPVLLPSFTGSALRGALGHAMRRVRYGRMAACTHCSIRPACRYGSLYAYLFESPCDHPIIEPVHANLNPRMRRKTYPQPFVLEPPEGGEYSPGRHLLVPIVVIGKAIAYMPFLICSLSIMGTSGIGKGRGRIFLEDIVNGLSAGNGGEQVIYDGISGQIVGPGEVIDLNDARHWAKQFAPSECLVRKARVMFVTPFRYRYQGKLGQPLTFEIFMRNLLRRLTLLSIHSPVTFPVDHGQLLALAASVQVNNSSLKWHRLERYSGRQKQWMNLDGFVGDIVFSGDLGPFLPYLKMGEFLNVGKDGSFGLGKYRIYSDSVNT